MTTKTGIAWHRVTKEEKEIIREAARREGGRKIEVGYRIKLDAPHHDPQMNIALLTDDDDFDGTDLFDHRDWKDFCRGFELAENGKAIVDFYVYSTGYHGELEGNVTAYWLHDRLERVEGTMGNIYWKRAE